MLTAKDGYQGRIEPPEVARGHATSFVGNVDSEM